MQSPKKVVKKVTGIRLTSQRANTVLPVEVDFGAFGTGILQVRPLLYTDVFRSNIDKKMKEIIESGEEGVEALDAIQSYLLPLIADWDIFSPLEDVMACQEITDEEEIAKFKKKCESSETGTVYDDDTEQLLYKLPVNAKSMRLFPILGNTSGIDAILKALSSLSFS